MAKILGRTTGIETRDNRYHKPALYQLSYVRHQGRGNTSVNRSRSTAQRPGR